MAGTAVRRQARVRPVHRPEPVDRDETQDDPTIRRCIGFATAWGYSQFCMTNLFAYRATDPRNMIRVKDPVGPENDHWIQIIASGAAVTVAAWGCDGDHMDRGATVAKMLDGKLKLLRRTKFGHPQHPLYLPKSLSPLPF